MLLAIVSSDVSAVAQRDTVRLAGRQLNHKC